MQVNTFLVGSQRCSSTAWLRYLGTHPDVVTARRKEVGFFSEDLPLAQSVKSLEDYHALFEDREAKVRLDATTSHLFSTVAANRIHAYNPRARIIVLLRSPLAFLPSYHSFHLLFGNETVGSFERAWRLQARREQGFDIPGGCRHPLLLRYAHMARLGEQLSRYAALFPPDQIAVLDFEDWVKDPRRAYLALLRFLQLGDDGRMDFPRVNEAARLRSRVLESALRSRRLAPRALRGLVRRLPGVDGEGWMRRLRNFNRQAIRIAPLQGAFADEVMRELADDQALLDRLAEPYRLLRRKPKEMP